MSIHFEDPFSVPVELRDPVRRLRGRLPSPVTILTSGEERPVGITVSSFIVVEGDEPRTAALVGPGSDFVDAVEESGGFVAHVLDADEANLADVFAGLRPSPGGMFASVEVEDTRWGPRIAHIRNWAGCRTEELRRLGDQLLLVGIIESLEVGDLKDPLVYFRGRYRQLKP
ncbi:MAG TPA: flavin reductase family protein [Acidimicrobiia bacterium]|nr:flavin reductase family protein [Acidimicrobiia bacterium]